MKKILILIQLFIIPLSYSQEDTSKEKVIYKYKQYQKFDFSEISVDGDRGSPGDLSITPRLQPEFSNSLPYRKNFYPEIHKSIERVR